MTRVLPGFVDTNISAPLSMPKADPAAVAARASDGWLAGAATVWPDAFAELVRDCLGADFLRLLDNPVRVATEIQTAYRPSPAWVGAGTSNRRGVQKRPASSGEQ